MSESIGTVRIDINDGAFKPVKEKHFDRMIYENSRGAQKNFSWLNSLTTVASDMFNCVPQPLIDGMNCLGKTASVAAPLCGMNEAVTYGIDAVRAFVKLTGECTVDAAYKALGFVLKCAQRVAEAVTGIMKLGFMDVTCLLGAKFFKDFFAIFLDVMIIKEATDKDAKIANIVHAELREAAELTNNLGFYKGFIGLTFHGMNLTGLLCAGVVTFNMVITLATLFTVTVLSAAYCALKEDEIRNDLALKVANGEIKPLGVPA